MENQEEYFDTLAENNEYPQEDPEQKDLRLELLYSDIYEIIENFGEIDSRLLYINPIDILNNSYFISKSKSKIKNRETINDFCMYVYEYLKNYKYMHYEIIYNKVINIILKYYITD